MRFKFACLLTVPVLAVMSQSARANQIAYEGFSLTFPAYNTGYCFCMDPGRKAASKSLRPAMRPAKDPCFM